MRSVFSKTTVLVVSGLIMSDYNIGAQTHSTQAVALAKPNFYITTPQTGEQVQAGPSVSSVQPNSQTAQVQASTAATVADNHSNAKPSKSANRSIRPASQSASDQAALQYAAYNAALQAQNANTQATAQQQSAYANYYTHTANNTAQVPATNQTNNISYSARPASEKKGLINRLFHKHEKVQPAVQVTQVSNTPYKSSKLSGTTLAGTASWYGKDFHGGKTASGERYNMESMTAAHKTLPFGTMVKVRNERNGRECIVRINNRGPFIKGRILDVSKAAATRLGMVSSGVAKVTCQVIGRS